MYYKTFRFKSLTSTQDKAKEFAKKGIVNAIVISDVQTKGRGRFGRKWHSSRHGLWMTILLKPKNIGNLQYLTFGAAIAVVNSIKKVTGLSTNIKWPNDVHYKGKKLCGILTEGIFGKENHVMVGIGININQKTFPLEIRNTAISLRMIKKKSIMVEKIRKNILDEFFNLYKNYYEKNKVGNILKIWKKHCDTLNKNIAVINGTEKLYGKSVGIDNNCNLLLKLQSNRIVSITEGDIIMFKR